MTDGDQPEDTGSVWAAPVTFGNGDSPSPSKSSGRRPLSERRIADPTGGSGSVGRGWRAPRLSAVRRRPDAAAPPRSGGPDEVSGEAGDVITPEPDRPTMGTVAAPGVAAPGSTKEAPGTAPTPAGSSRTETGGPDWLASAAPGGTKQDGLGQTAAAGTASSGQADVASPKQDKAPAEGLPAEGNGLRPRPGGPVVAPFAAVIAGAAGAPPDEGRLAPASVGTETGVTPDPSGSVRARKAAPGLTGLEELHPDPKEGRAPDWMARRIVESEAPGAAYELGKQRRWRRRKVTVLRSRTNRRLVRRIDTWTVFKVSFIFYVLLLAIVLVAGVATWSVAQHLGFIGDIQKSVRSLADDKTFVFHGDVALRYAAAGGGVLALLGTLFNTVAAMLYNLISDVVGGLQVIVVTQPD